MTCAHASAKPLSGEGGGRSECQQQSDCREKHRAGTCRGAGRIQVHVGRCGRGGRDPANHTHGHHQQPVSNPNAAGPGSPAVSARQLLEIRRHSVAAGACAVRPVASHLAAGAADAHVGSHHNVLVQAASRLDETKGQKSERGKRSGSLTVGAAASREREKQLALVAEQVGPVSKQRLLSGNPTCRRPSWVKSLKFYTEILVVAPPQWVGAARAQPRQPAQDPSVSIHVRACQLQAAAYFYAIRPRPARAKV